MAAVNAIAGRYPNGHTQRIKRALREEYDPQSQLWRRLVIAQSRVFFGRFFEQLLSETTGT